MGPDSFFIRKMVEEINYLQQQVPENIIKFFRTQAEQKIEAEKWAGRNKEVKIQNFVHCWVTEEAFKQILIKEKKWFRHRGLYFGDAVGAGADFTVKIEGKEVSVGLRSVAPESLNTFKSVAYPDDRFRDEKEKIADYHIVCNHEDGLTKFYGIISKEELLHALEHSRVLYSRKNQEKFRVIPLQRFQFQKLQELFAQIEIA